MPKAAKETIPDGAIFQPQPKSAAGRPASKAEMEMIRKSYYERGSVGRDSMFDWLKTKYPDTHPPRRTIQRFLNRQMLQQRLSIPRKSTTGQPFRPISPFHSFSIDLLDLTNKPAKNYRYIIGLIDNFTRFQWLVPITGKEAWKVAKAMKKLLDEIQAKYKKQPKFILQDLGNEFEGPYKQLLISRGIKIKKTLPASPWQNAIAERNAGGRVKVWLWKKMRVKGGSWLDHLDEALEVANNTMNRMTGFTPKNALSLDKAGRETLRERVLRSQEEGGRPPRPDYPLNLAVRVKLAKGLLSKQTDWSWSKKIYKITGVFPGKSPMEATRYSINKPGSKNEGLRYGPHDLKPLIEGPAEPIPGADSSDDDDDDDGDGDDAVAAKATEDKAAKAAANKKKKGDDDEEIVASYKGKTVKTDQDGGDQGKVIEVARRKVGGRRQWRIKVRFTDGFEKWYSRREIDTFLKEQ